MTWWSFIAFHLDLTNWVYTMFLTRSKGEPFTQRQPNIYSMIRTWVTWAWLMPAAGCELPQWHEKLMSMRICLTWMHLSPKPLEDKDRHGQPTWLLEPLKSRWEQQLSCYSFCPREHTHAQALAVWDPALTVRIPTVQGAHFPVPLHSIISTASCRWQSYPIQRSSACVCINKDSCSDCFSCKTTTERAARRPNQNLHPSPAPPKINKKINAGIALKKASAPSYL